MTDGNGAFELCIKSGDTMTHPRLGRVSVAVNASSRKLCARWSGGRVKVVAPRLCPYSTLTSFLDECADALLAHRPKTPEIADGSVITLPLLSITFASDRAIPPGKLVVNRDADNRLTLLHHPDTDISDTARLSAVIEKAVGRLCGHLLVSHAREVAASLRLHPREWRLGSGKRILGTCSALGMITLSRMLLFLPRELMDYVIFHELAHLTHHDHSPEFHALLDRYCGGREKEFVTRLRQYSWPIVR